MRFFYFLAKLSWCCHCCGYCCCCCLLCTHRFDRWFCVILLLHFLLQLHFVVFSSYSCSSCNCFCGSMSPFAITTYSSPFHLFPSVCVWRITRTIWSFFVSVINSICQPKCWCCLNYVRTPHITTCRVISISSWLCSSPFSLQSVYNL